MCVFFERKKTSSLNSCCHIGRQEIWCQVCGVCAFSDAAGGSQFLLPSSCGVLFIIIVIVVSDLLFSCC